MVLKVENLNKSYKDKEVLKGINFQIDKGEIVSIIGQSGAGKTTILRCINGLEDCDSGNIEIDGKKLNDINSSKEQIRIIRRNIGMVFQNLNLFPHMSVLENIIEAPVNVFKIPKDEAVNKAMGILKTVGLEDKAKSYPFELSGGQKQRVAIARACALNPKIMCFDEPTSALDPELTEGIASIIEKLSESGMAVLIITHDMLFAKRVSQRVMFMEDGKILEEGTVEDIFNNPKEERTRNFVFT